MQNRKKPLLRQTRVAKQRRNNRRPINIPTCDPRLSQINEGTETFQNHAETPQNRAETPPPPNYEKNVQHYPQKQRKHALLFLMLWLLQSGHTIFPFQNRRWLLHTPQPHWAHCPTFAGAPQRQMAGFAAIR